MIVRVCTCEKQIVIMLRSHKNPIVRRNDTSSRPQALRPPQRQPGQLVSIAGTRAWQSFPLLPGVRDNRRPDDELYEMIQMVHEDDLQQLLLRELHDPTLMYRLKDNMLLMAVDAITCQQRRIENNEEGGEYSEAYRFAGSKVLTALCSKRLRHHFDENVLYYEFFWHLAHGRGQVALSMLAVRAVNLKDTCMELLLKRALREGKDENNEIIRSLLDDLNFGDNKKRRRVENQ